MDGMVNESKKLAGVLAVFQTPWHDDENLDSATLHGEIDWIDANGAAGIVMAMVSEVLRMSTQERDELATMACRFNHSRGAVVISVGAESARVAEHYAKHAEDVGADAVMAIPPLSVAALESELLKYF